MNAPRIVASFTHPAHLYAFSRFTQVALFDAKTWKHKRPEEEHLRWSPGSVRVVEKEGELKLEPLYATRRDAEPVRDRWISVFSNIADKDRVQWWAELYVDEDGQISVNPALDKQSRRLWNPGGATRTTLQHELPHVVQGRKIAYCLIGTPFQLTDSCIDALERDNRLVRCVPFLDLTDTQHIVDRHSWHDGAKVPSELIAIPVLLPFDVARRLAQDIECLVSVRLNEQGLDGRIAAASPQQLENAKGYHFAKILESVANNPDLTRAARGFGDQGREKLRSFIDERERSFRKLDMVIEAAADDLACWLDRTLVHILMNGAYPEDEDKVLVALDEAMAPLTQTTMGLYALERLLRDPPEGGFLQRYFAPRVGLGDTERGCASKVGANYISLLQTIYTVKFSSHLHDVTNTLYSLTNALGDLVPWEGRPPEVRIVAIRQFAILGDAIPEGVPKRSVWLKVKTLVANDDALKKLNAFAGRADVGIKFFDSINLITTWRAYMDTPVGQDALRTKRGLEAFSASASLFAGIVDKTFDAIGRSSVPLSGRIAVRGVGFIGAAVSLWTSRQDLGEAERSGDSDAVTALMTFAMASTAAPILRAFGAALGISGFMGPIAWTLEAIGLAAYVWYLYVKNSELETLIENSAFGEQDPSDLPSRATVPSWSPVPLPALADKWSYQLSAISNLIFQFEVGFGDLMVLKGNKTPFRTTRIFVGRIEPKSAFHVRWTWETATKTGQTDEIWIANSDHQESQPRTFRSYSESLRYDEQKQLYFDILPPEQAIKDSGYLSGGSYGFRVLLVEIYKQNEGGQRIPLHNTVQFTVHEHAVPLPDRRSRSLDVQG